MLHFEDFEVGAKFTSEPRVIERDEMITFARKYDPQPFHTGDDADSVAGGMIASGYHTAAICQGLLVRAFLTRSTCLGSPGIDELRWLAPVRPGMELTAEAEVLSTEPSRSRGDRGKVTFRYTLRSGALTVFTLVTSGFFRRRDPAA